MSQVIRKYNPGGKVEKSKLFSVSGLGDFDQNALIERGYRDIDTYIALKGLKGNVASSFKDAVQHMLTGIGDGTFSIDAMGNYTDQTGKATSTGDIDRKKFLGIKTGIKDTENNAYGIAADYIHKLIMSSPKYTAPKESEPKPWDFWTDLRNVALGGKDSIDDWNMLDYNPVTKKWETTIRNKYINEVLSKRLKYLEENPNFDYNKDVYSSSNEYLSAFRDAVESIKDGKYDPEDYVKFAKLGITDMDKYLLTDFSTPSNTPAALPIEGRVGKVDTGWQNPDYERTIDDKGVYHIYKKGSGEEVNGIIPGNVFNGVGNTYAYDGNIYDDSNLPEKYRLDIDRARLAQLNEYTILNDNNPFTKMLKGLGYNYITNLSQFASNVGNNILYGAYQDPTKVGSKIGFYLRDPETGKSLAGLIQYNNALKEYLFIGENGKVINLGKYNDKGLASKESTSFVDYTNTSKENLDKLMRAWMTDSDLNNSASEAYKMVQNTLSKWINSGDFPFENKGGQYQWNQGDYYMVAKRNPTNGLWSWAFNDSIKLPNTQLNEVSYVNRLNLLINKMGRDMPPEEWEELRKLKALRIKELLAKAQKSEEEEDEYYRLTSFKNGGIVSAQLGIKFADVEDPSVYTGLPEASEEQKQKAKMVNDSYIKQQNVNLGTLFSDKPYGENKKLTDAGGVLSNDDKWKLKLALADIASTGVGFIPGLNILSAVTGAGSSLGNFIIDVKDGFQWGDVGNLAMNLGMDALSLIPAGKATKAFRSLKTISGMAPLIMTTLNVMGLADPELRASYESTLNKIKNINKIDSLKSLNTGDILNLNAMLGMVLGVRNVARSRKGWWNSSTSPSGKKRVTATINGTQQTLEVDDAFFKNTKGKNQVSELKTKFAEQYNKANKLEGDKAIKPEDVSVDTKYFGLRPQSEKVKGTKNDGNWFANTLLGKHMIGYKDPSIARGNPDIPFTDAWFYKKWKGLKNVQSETTNNINKTEGNGAPLTSAEPPKSTSLVLIPGKRNEYTNWNNEIQGYEKNFRQNEAERIYKNRLKIDDSKYYGDGTIPVEGIPSEFTGVDAKQLRAANRVAKLLNVAVDAANQARQPRNLPAIVRKPLGPSDYIRGAEARNSIKVIPQKLRMDQFIEDQIPGGLVYGRARNKYERELRDILYPATEREQQAMWSNFKATKQHDINQRKVAERDIARAQERKKAEEVKRSVDRQIALTLAKMEVPTISKKEHSRRLKELNEAFIPDYLKTLDGAFKRELPHKKSNKKKKTSKDDTKTKRREFGGIIFKDGGLIPKYLGGNVMQRGVKGTWLNNNNTYLDATNLNSWGDYYNMSGIMNDIIKLGMPINNADEWISTANKLSSMDLPWNKQLNARGYKDWNTLYSSTGLNKYFGEDQNKFDYLGPSTWNRRLLLQNLGSMYSSPDTPLTIGNDNVWYDNGTWRKMVESPELKVIKLQDGNPELQAPIAPLVMSSLLSQPISYPKAQLKQSPRNASTGKPANYEGNPLKKFSIYPEDALAFGRMVGGLVTNNRVAKTYKEGLRPTLIDTFENYVPLQGNFLAKTSGELLAGNIQSIAAMPRTSDASLLLAGELDASSKAAQSRMQGDLADAERFYQTRMLGQQESDAAKARRVEVANKNKASSNAIIAAKKLIDAGRDSANYLLVVAPWLAGIENQYRQTRAMQKQLGLESYMQKSNLAYNNELSDIFELYKNNPSEFNKQKVLLDAKYSKQLLDERKKLLGSPWLIQFAKSGSKLTYAEKAMLQRAKDFNRRLAQDNKLFHKDIMESKREHNKLIMNMSALTAALIKKGMQL